MTARGWLGLLALIVVVAASAPRPAAAQTTDFPPTCVALKRGDFSKVLDAPTSVMSAQIVAASKDAPLHCMVVAYVTPNVGLDIRLPEHWNGKFATVGCGGFCGAPYGLPSCTGLLTRGYACVTSDMGHQSTALDGKWAYNNLQAEFDFGVRATHVQTLAGKAISAAFYGRAPERTYYMGCSTGGRQGMVAAQRFPTDFDGIIAGAPVINESGDGMTLLWNVLALRAPDGGPMLTFDNIRALHAAVIATCDLNDGIKDGLIGDPRRCRFDPASMQTCKTPSDSACLTAAQVAAIRKVYAGPTNSKGEAVSIARALPGSELNWLNSYLGPPGQNATYFDFQAELFRYMVFYPDPGPQWAPQDFDWDRDPPRLNMMEALYNAQNPDLRAFKAHGGKLIVYHGWADNSVLPQLSVDYNEMVTRAMGGRAATQDFYRLFIIPGMSHCLGGEGAHRVDYLSYLEDWVERGRAPDMLLAQHPKDWQFTGLQFGISPLPAEAVAFSRPVYPYPQEPRYRGRGDPANAASYASSVTN